MIAIVVGVVVVVDRLNDEYGCLKHLKYKNCVELDIKYIVDNFSVVREKVFYL